MKSILNKSGVSIIATVLTLLMLAVFGAVVVSLVTTGSSIGLQEEQGVQAFYIAEGGLQYALKNGTFCTYSYTDIPLGNNGSFTVTSQENTATMNGSIDNVTDPVDVPLTAPPSNFTIPGTIKIDSEYLFCNDISGSDFTECERAVAGSSIASHTDSSVSQCVVTSTGTVSSGVFFGNVQRVVQATVGE